MGVCDPRHGDPIVPDADQCAAQGIHRLAGELTGTQPGAVDDGIDFELPQSVSAWRQAAR